MYETLHCYYLVEIQVGNQCSIFSNNEKSIHYFKMFWSTKSDISSSDQSEITGALI